MQIARDVRGAPGECVECLQRSAGYLASARSPFDESSQQAFKGFAVPLTERCFERGALAAYLVPETDSVRATRWRSNTEKATPIYLAQAEGLALRIVCGLGRSAS